MKLLSLKGWLAAAVLVTAFGTYGDAQILRLDLQKMVASTDGAVIGTITDKETIRIDHPVDGPELYFTTLTIQGSDLNSGEQKTISVSYAGGFTDPERGVYNSEEPEADVVRVGNEVLAFHKWTDNMGGDFAANSLFAAHGGIYSTFKNPQGQMIVQGRGDGYAIRSNTFLTNLTQNVRQLAAQQPR